MLPWRPRCRSPPAALQVRWRRDGCSRARRRCEQRRGLAAAALRRKCRWLSPSLSAEQQRRRQRVAERWPLALALGFGLRQAAVVAERWPLALPLGLVLRQAQLVVAERLPIPLPLGLVLRQAELVVAERWPIPLPLGLVLRQAELVVEQLVLGFGRRVALRQLALWVGVLVQVALLMMVQEFSAPSRRQRWRLAVP